MRVYVGCVQPPPKVTQPCPLSLRHYPDDIIRLYISTFSMIDAIIDALLPTLFPHLYLTICNGLFLSLTFSIIFTCVL